MLFAGHIGISLVLINGFEAIVRLGKRNIGNRASVGRRAASMDTRFMDYRFVAIGAVLPDLIDKPLVQLIYGLSQHEGHLIAHTVTFCFMLIFAGAYLLFTKGKVGVLLLGVCSLLHWLQDWLLTGQNVLLHKLFGKLFFLVPANLGILEESAEPVYQLFPYLRGVQQYLLQPYVYIFEVLGAGILVLYGIRLLKRKSVLDFLRTGRL